MRSSAVKGVGTAGMNPERVLMEVLGMTLQALAGDQAARGNGCVAGSGRCERVPKSSSTM
jgi:hypothetical protein